MKIDFLTKRQAMNGKTLQQSLKHWVTAITVGSCLATFPGCGASSSEPLAAVTGTVTENGKPLSGANIMFIPQSGVGAPSGGKTDDSGSFQLQYTNGRTGAILGKHRVVISIPAAEAPPPMGGETKPVKQQTSPEYYKQADVIDTGDNEFTFEVTEK